MRRLHKLLFFAGVPRAAEETKALCNYASWLSRGFLPIFEHALASVLSRGSGSDAGPPNPMTLHRHSPCMVPIVYLHQPEPNFVGSDYQTGYRICRTLQQRVLVGCGGSSQYTQSPKALGHQAAPIPSVALDLEVKVVEIFPDHWADPKSRSPGRVLQSTP